MIVDSRKLDADLAAGAALQKECCSKELLKLAQEGVLSSPHSSNKVIKFCKEAWS